MLADLTITSLKASMHWSVWAICGFVLLTAELMSPGSFFILFFAIGAFVVALTTAIDLTAQEWAQWTLFATVSIGSILILRKRLVNMVAPHGVSADIDSLVGNQGIARETISPQGRGRVEVRGTTWNAVNIGSTVVGEGTRITVERNEELTLFIKEA